MAQWWSDHIDLLRQGGGEVISPGKSEKANPHTKVPAAKSAFDPVGASAGGTSAHSIEIPGSLDVILNAHSGREKAAMSVPCFLSARF